MFVFWLDHNINIVRQVDLCKQKSHLIKTKLTVSLVFCFQLFQCYTLQHQLNTTTPLNYPASQKKEKKKTYREKKEQELCIVVFYMPENYLSTCKFNLFNTVLLFIQHANINLVSVKHLYSYDLLLCVSKYEKHF